MAYLYTLSAHYSNGFLPEAGGILDQSRKLMAALAILDNTKHDCADEKRSQEVSREKRQAKQVAMMQGRRN